MGRIRSSHDVEFIRDQVRGTDAAMMQVIMSFLVGLCLLVLMLTGEVSSQNVRVVTWNVADNKKMNDGFTDDAIDKVLGLNSQTVLADIYAIGIQENCWSCNHGSFSKIGKKFLDRIEKKRSGYEVVHIEGTRESSFCRAGCTFGTHGTTLVLAIARIGLVSSVCGFHRNDDCSSATPQNDEKGVAAVKLSLDNGKVACFGSLHLESGDATTRRECLRLFFKDANTQRDDLSWSTKCDYQFLFGDFNTRTGDKIKDVGDKGVYLAEGDDKLKALKIKDELTGDKPYGTDDKWSKNLLAYVNDVQPNTFVEPPVDFMPTYSIRPSSECSGRKTCYKASRPISWTDRIIHTGAARVDEYGCVVEEYADHFPVYARYRLN